MALEVVEGLAGVPPMMVMIVVMTPGIPPVVGVAEVDGVAKIGGVAELDIDEL